MNQEKYCLKELEKVLQRDLFWLLRNCQDDIKKKLNFNDDYIDAKSYVQFIKWYNKNYTEALPIPKVEKRKYSTTHRIEIAYKTKYRCGMCDKILPPTFEIDHIIELRDGGKDEYQNLWSLCNDCHAEKTRANTLKHNELFKNHFGKKCQEIEEKAFEKFKYKKSKFF